MQFLVYLALVLSLGSDDYAARELAHARLAKAMPAAQAALEWGAGHHDAEIAARCASILGPAHAAEAKTARLALIESLKPASLKGDWPRLTSHPDSSWWLWQLSIGDFFLDWSRRQLGAGALCEDVDRHAMGLYAVWMLDSGIPPESIRKTMSEAAGLELGEIARPD